MNFVNFACLIQQIFFSNEFGPKKLSSYILKSPFGFTIPSEYLFAFELEEVTYNLELYGTDTVVLPTFLLLRLHKVKLRAVPIEASSNINEQYQT